MKIERLGKIAGGQDGAIWKDYLFRFDADGSCRVFRFSDCIDVSLDEKVPVASFKLDRADSFVPHSNAVVFGREYYSPEDEFPLLYSNIYNNYARTDDPQKGVVCVYRLQRNGVQFSTTLVQVIEIGFVEDDCWKSQNVVDIRPYGNFVIDCDKAVYYAFTMRDEEQTTRYFSFPLPKAADGEMDEKLKVRRVILNKEDILEQFDCEYHRFIQGACFYNGKIYSVEGFTNNEQNPPALRIIDTVNKRQEKKVLFAEYVPNIEPEWIDFKDDVCYYSDNQGNFYRIEFGE